MLLATRTSRVGEFIIKRKRCQACGGILDNGLLPGTIKKGHRLCGQCYQRWQGLSVRIGREATWREMKNGVYINDRRNF